MNVSLMIVTVGGLGLLRPAPGTWGSLPPVVIAFALVMLVEDLWVINAALGLLLLLSSMFCVLMGRWAEVHFGKKDASSVVIDEVAGQSLTLLFLPWQLGPDASLTHNLLLAGAAFVLFRLFDISKPPPIHGLQRLPAGWGVLVDDLLAGIYALIVVQLFAHLVLV